MQSDHTYAQTPIDVVPPSHLRLCYILLSPTFGMHQYTADYANRMVAAGHEVTLITTSAYPADRYAPEVTVHTPVATRDSGFSLQGLLGLLTAWKRLGLDTLLRSDVPTLSRFDVVHFTGPHLWNPHLLYRLRRLGIPTLHTLHDLDPHPGSPYGPLLHLWNRAVLHTATAILVHGKRYQERLSRYSSTHLPLLHLFLSYELSSELDASIHTPDQLSPVPTLSRSAAPTVLFFGRLEKYKGVAVLLEAWSRYKAAGRAGRLILAGKGELQSLWSGALPPEVELRQHRIEDDEALALFRQASLVVLPYIGATQSALIPAAYAFGKPVIASRSGALPEYVEEGRTGWLVPPGDAGALAAALAEALQSLDAPERRRDFALNCGKWYTTQREAEEAALSHLYTSLRGRHEHRSS